MDSRNGSELGGLITYQIGFNGTAELTTDMGVNISLSYNRADLVPGGTVPVQISYTPVDLPGSEFSLDVTADATADVDVDLAAEIGICIAIPPVCPFLVILDNIEGDLNNFTVIAGDGDFAAPLDAEPPAVIPLGGDTAALQFFTGDNLVEASAEGSITLSPVGPGTLPGWGAGRPRRRRAARQLPGHTPKRGGARVAKFGTVASDFFTASGKPGCGCKRVIKSGFCSGWGCLRTFA
jgi:hypothetical protein